MTNTPETETTESLTLSVKFHGGNTVTLQQVFHGMQPAILIEMGLADDDETMHFDVNATGPESQADLADILEMLTYALRQGTVTSSTIDGLTAVPITEDDLDDSEKAGE